MHSPPASAHAVPADPLPVRQNLAQTTTSECAPRAPVLAPELPAASILGLAASQSCLSTTHQALGHVFREHLPSQRMMH